jgi:signal transduction histidine kinase
VENILDATKAASKTLTVEWEKIDLTAFFADLQQLCRLPAGAKTELRWIFPPDTFSIQTDGKKLRRILRSLIDNSVKFTSEGRITVAARLLETDAATEKERHLNATTAATHPDRPSGCLEFTVSDTGIGIEEEDLPFIFDVFYQIDGSSTRCYEGVGLGLFIARSFVEILGGAIAVESVPNQGSTFIVRLPVPRAMDGKTRAESADSVRDDRNG